MVRSARLLHPPLRRRPADGLNTLETVVANPFTAILGDGETILWQGQPDKAAYRKGPERRLTLVVFWFFIFLGSVLLLEGEWLDPDSAAWQFPTLGLVTLVIAASTIYCVVAKDEGQGRHYAVTDRYVLFHDSSGEDDVTTCLALEHIDLVWLRSKHGYDGSVIFAAKPPFKRVTFRYLADADEVQGLVVSLLLGAREGTGLRISK